MGKIDGTRVDEVDAGPGTDLEKSAPFQAADPPPPRGLYSRCRAVLACFLDPEPTEPANTAEWTVRTRGAPQLRENGVDRR